MYLQNRQLLWSYFRKSPSSNTYCNHGAIVCWRDLEQGVGISYTDGKAFPDTAVCKLGLEGTQGSGARS